MMDLYTLVLLGITVYLLYRFLNKHKNLPPGPKGLPLIGNLHQITTVPFKKHLEFRKQYGDIFSLQFGAFPAVVLCSPKLIREAFNDNRLNGRPIFQNQIRRSGNDGTIRGVIFTQEKVWSDQRRFVLKTLRDFGFGKKSLEGYIQEEIKELIETFKKDGGKPMTTLNKFNAPVVNVLWRLVTGERHAHDDPKLQTLIQGITTTISSTRASDMLMFFPPLEKLVRTLQADKRSKLRAKSLHNQQEFMTGTIEHHKKTFEPNSEPRDLIDMYLAEISKTENPQSSFFKAEGEKHLRLVMMDLFVAGAETTSTTLTWLFLLMALNPEEQNKLFREIKSVVGTARMPSLADRPNMPYTEAMIMEVMRYSSMIPMGVTHTAIEDVEFHGYTIPKGTLVMPNLYCVMHDPEIWGDPETFRPSRFLSEDGKKVVKHEALLPFSVGKRVCLGETLARDELFLMVTSLFQIFRVTPVPNKPKPTLDYIVTSAVLILKPHELMLLNREEDEDNKL